MPAINNGRLPVDSALINDGELPVLALLVDRSTFNRACIYSNPLYHLVNINKSAEEKKEIGGSTERCAFHCRKINTQHFAEFNPILPLLLLLLLLLFIFFYLAFFLTAILARQKKSAARNHRRKIDRIFQNPNKCKWKCKCAANSMKLDEIQ